MFIWIKIAFELYAIYCNHGILRNIKANNSWNLNNMEGVWLGKAWALKPDTRSGDQTSVGATSTCQVTQSLQFIKQRYHCFLNRRTNPQHLMLCSGPCQHSLSVSCSEQELDNTIWPARISAQLCLPPKSKFFPLLLCY